MRIRCPSCSAIYDVPDAMLDPPRVVRCAKCAHDWMAEPIAADLEFDEPPVAAEAPASAPIAEPAAYEPSREVEPVRDRPPPSALERLAAPSEMAPRIRRRDRWLTTAWAASFAALTALGVAGYTQRDRLMQEWPASKRIYATFGLTADLAEQAPGDLRLNGMKESPNRH
jgi:predicted Zn finger-like uncharacterized protein